MSRILHLFKIIDQLLFEKIDRLKVHPSYQQFVDKIAGFDEKKQKIINHSIVIATTTLPVIILFFVFIGNCSLRNDLSIQKEILSLLNNIHVKKSKISLVGQQFFAPHLVNNKSEFQKIITNLLASKQIPASKVSISTFKQNKSTKTISEVESAISFNQFSITELSNFLTILIEKEKVKISNFNISKAKDDSLQGVIQIIHHGKSV